MRFVGSVLRFIVQIIMMLRTFPNELNGKTVQIHRQCEEQIKSIHFSMIARTPMRSYHFVSFYFSRNHPFHMYVYVSLSVLIQHSTFLYGVLLIVKCNGWK